MVPGKIWWKNNKALIWYNLPRRCEIFINYYPGCLTGLADTNRWKQGFLYAKKQPHTKQIWREIWDEKLTIGKKYWILLDFHQKLPCQLSLVVTWMLFWNLYMFQMLEKHHSLPLGWRILPKLIEFFHNKSPEVHFVKFCYFFIIYCPRAPILAFSCNFGLYGSNQFYFDEKNS